MVELDFSWFRHKFEAELRPINHKQYILIQLWQKPQENIESIERLSVSRVN